MFTLIISQKFNREHFLSSKSKYYIQLGNAKYLQQRKVGKQLPALFFKKSRSVESASKSFLKMLLRELSSLTDNILKNVILTEIVLSVQVALETDLCKSASNELDQ